MDVLFLVSHLFTLTPSSLLPHLLSLPVLQCPSFSHLLADRHFANSLKARLFPLPWLLSSWWKWPFGGNNVGQTLFWVWEAQSHL